MTQLFFFGLFLMILLLTRLLVLQWVEHKHYSTLARENRLSLIPQAPSRGLIYDRNGILLASNQPSFSLVVIPASSPHLKQHLQALAQLVSLSSAELAAFYKRLHYYHAYQAVPLKGGLTPKEAARFYVNQFRFPGMNIQIRTKRYYPLQQSMAAVLGYVGRINTRDLSHLDQRDYSATTRIGKTGIEAYYEKQLHGHVGFKTIETNARGDALGTLSYQPAQAGSSLVLTIDSRLQTVIQQAMQGESGAAVAIDPRNGEILALTSSPTYNPNAFVQGLSTQAYQKLAHSPLHPLYNRAIRGQFAIGSTVKPFYALLSLDQGIITPTTHIHDPGYFQLPHTKHVYHDWMPGGHGWVNVTKALYVSCDTFFYQLATMAGITRLDHDLSTFGFGRKTGIDLLGEKSGLIPSPAWKKRTLGIPWYTGDTIITGIGQGSLTATPLQLAQATAMLAMKGVSYQPHLLLKISHPGGESVTVKPLHHKPLILKQPQFWKTVSDAMQAVIHNPHGTGRHFGRHPAYTVALKTGTAQIYGRWRNEYDSKLSIPKKLRNNHLVIAYAPVDHPRIAVAVIVEHAAKAALIARSILDTALVNATTALPSSPTPRSKGAA